MRTAATVTGVMAGISGVLGALGAWVVTHGETTSVGAAISLDAVAMVCALLAFLAVRLISTQPQRSTVLFMGAAIGTVMTIWVFAVVAAPLYLLASLLTHLGRERVIREGVNI